MKKNEKIILFGKPTHWFETVEQFLLENFEDVRIYTGDWGDKFPEVEEKISDDGKHYKIPIDFSCDYLISFCCPWIFKKKVLDCAKIAAINFHPAPPKYPGIGGYNYAIFNKDDIYGVTVHHMSEKVDTGGIINISEFPLYGNETAISLKNRSMNYLIELFFLTIDNIIKNNRINIQDDYKWARNPYTLNEFQEFCNLGKYKWGEDVDYDPEFYDGLYRALYFPNALDCSYIIVNGKKWKLEPMNDTRR